MHAPSQQPQHWWWWLVYVEIYFPASACRYMYVGTSHTPGHTSDTLNSNSWVLWSDIPVSRLLCLAHHTLSLSHSLSCCTEGEASYLFSLFNFYDDVRSTASERFATYVADFIDHFKACSISMGISQIRSQRIICRGCWLLLGRQFNTYDFCTSYPAAPTNHHPHRRPVLHSLSLPLSAASCEWCARGGRYTTVNIIRH